MEDFVDKGQWVRFSVNPEEVEQNASAKFDPKDVCIYFATNEVISNVNILEEYIHAYQFRVAYYGNIPSTQNLEFEAKMFYDWMKGKAEEADVMDCFWHKLHPGFINNILADNVYENFWFEFISNGYALGENWELAYKELGYAWRDPAYNHITEVFGDITPKLIKKFIPKK